MKKYLKDERGLSLTELLATIGIGSLVIILVMSTFIFVQKQYSSQTENVRHTTDISIALKSVTTDIRKGDSFYINDDNSLTIETTDKEDIIYTLQDNILQKNGMNYIYDIRQFQVVKEQSKLKVFIESESGKNLETEIIQRGGSDEQEE